MKKIGSAILGLILLLGVTPTVSRPIDKIYVSKAGAIFLDGKGVTPEALRVEFKRLKKAGGIVWYSRENAGVDPTDKQMVAIKLVIDQQLPIQLYTNKTFTTVVTVPQP